MKTTKNNMTAQEQLINAMQQLGVPEQIAVIEGYIDDHGLDGESATVLSMLMMNVLADLDGGEYPAELVQRANTVTTTIRDFNEQRFNT